MCSCDAGGAQISALRLPRTEIALHWTALKVMNRAWSCYEGRRRVHPRSNICRACSRAHHWQEGVGPLLELLAQRAVVLLDILEIDINHTAEALLLHELR